MAFPPPPPSVATNTLIWFVLPFFSEMNFEAEYINNLQKQICLLEYETTYLYPFKIMEFYYKYLWRFQISFIS